MWLEYVAGLDINSLKARSLQTFITELRDSGCLSTETGPKHAGNFSQGNSSASECFSVSSQSSSLR